MILYLVRVIRTDITNEYQYIKKPGGVADLIAPGFNPGDLDITCSLRFGRKSINFEYPLPPKPNVVWSAIFCSELRVISKIMTLH